LVHRGAKTEELAYLIKTSAKTRCRWETPKTTHRVIALFDATVILFQAIVEILVGSVEDISAKGLTNGSWIRVMSIGRHTLWRMTHRLESLLEKALGSLHIPLLAEPRINQVPISIDSAVEVAPFPMHFDVGFIDVPGGACVPRRLARSWSANNGANRASQSRTVSCVNTKPRSRKHLGEIP